MAISKESNIDDLIKAFAEKSLELYHYVSADNSIGNPDFEPKKSLKMGKEIDKIAKIILASNLGQIKFLQLLDNKNLIIAYCAAEYLYPLNPRKCLAIMQTLYDKTTNKIDKYTIKTKIEGISDHQKFFVDNFKKLYNCEDLDSLNRERDM